MNLVNKTLDHVGILGIKIKSFGEMLQCSINHALASVDLSNHDMDRGFLGDLVLQVKQHLECIVVSVESHEDIGFLELVE